MPFDGSGNYSRVHDWTDDRDAGIKIRADRMDQEFDDLAASLNVVFFRNGLVPMSGDLDLGSNDLKGVATGTAVAPSIQFASDPNTGIYLNGAGKVGIAANGVQRFEVDTAGAEVFGTFDASGVGTFASDVSVGGTFDVTGDTTLSAALGVTGAATFASTVAITGVLSANGGINVLGGVLVPDGSQVAPTIAFSDDTDTGIFSPFTDAIAFTTGGTEAMRINSAGQVGIGKIPTIALDVVGAGEVTGNFTVGNALTSDTGVFTTSLTLGGNAVLTTASVIDADTFDGFDSTVFPRLGTANSFSQVQSFGNGVEMDRASGDAYILWKNATVNVAQLRVTSAGKLRFTDAAAALDMFSVDQSGSGYLRDSLGIGTASPDGTLHIADATSPDLILEDSGAATLTAVQGKVEFQRQADLAFGGMYVEDGTVDLIFATKFATGAIAFRTGADTERARIDGSGNVGIGATTPNFVGFSKALTVSGSNNGAIELTGGASGTDNLIGAVSFRSDTDAFETGRIGVNRRGVNTGDMRFDLGGSERMRIDSAGKLGIGINNPVDIVHAGGGNSLGFRYVSSGGVTAVLGDIAGVGGRVGTTSAHDFRIVAGTSNEVMRFQQATGNVGIGKTSPSAKLDVNGSIHDSKGDVRKIIKSGTTSGVLGAAVAGNLVRATAGVTIQDDVFAANDTLMIVNKSGGDITITQDTNLVLTDAAGNTGNRTLANHGVCTVWFNSTNDAIIFGTGLS